MSTGLRREIIKLLKEDEEFRYMVAGLIGIQEVLKRLDGIEREQKSLREEQIKMRQELIRLSEEQKSLREEQIKMRQELIRLREAQIKLSEEQKSLREEQIKMRQELIRLSEEQKSLREEQIKLREDFNKMLEEIKRINTRLSRIERTVEKLTIDVEEEARSFIKHHLKNAGINVEIDVLKLPEAEINVYGANDEWCVVGEASLRAGKKILDELLDKYRLLKDKYPGYLRKNIILVLYVTLPLPELVEEARRRNIWLLKATKEYVPLKEVLRKVKSS